MEHLQAERRTRLPASGANGFAPTDIVRQGIGLQACLGTVGAVEYLKANGINGVVIGRVLSGGQLREDDRAALARCDEACMLDA